MTKRELGKLKKNLPRGYRDTLAEQMGLSVTTVDMVFAGTRKNIPLIKAAVEMAKSHKEEMNNLSDEIKQL